MDSRGVTCLLRAPFKVCVQCVPDYDNTCTLYAAVDNSTSFSFSISLPYPLFLSNNPSLFLVSPLVSPLPLCFPFLSFSPQLQELNADLDQLESLSQLLKMVEGLKGQGLGSREDGDPLEGYYGK